MKRTALLHAQLSALVASMGHGDLLVLADAGLPIPTGVGAPQRIDLALCPGIPSLHDVLKTVLTELQVEQAWIASEALRGPHRIRPAWCAGEFDFEIQAIAHDELKARCAQARAVVRTGECTPFANIVLRAGVTF